MSFCRLKRAPLNNSKNGPSDQNVVDIHVIVTSSSRKQCIGPGAFGQIRGDVQATVMKQAPIRIFLLRSRTTRKNIARRWPKSQSAIQIIRFNSFYLP